MGASDFPEVSDYVSQMNLVMRQHYMVDFAILSQRGRPSIAFDVRVRRDSVRIRVGGFKTHCEQYSVKQIAARMMKHLRKHGFARPVEETGKFEWEMA